MNHPASAPGLREVPATPQPAAEPSAATAATAATAADLVPTVTEALYTARLTLRPATVADTDPTWVFRRLPEVNHWLTGTPADLEGYRALFADPERLASTVVVQLGHGVGGPVIGDFMLRREDAWAQLEVADQARRMQAELGWVLHPDHAGHGYATEAVRELLRYSFEVLRVRRVVANCFLANASSWRLMERVDMRRESHAVRESLHRTGQWLDTVTYAVLADEWADSAGEGHLVATGHVPTAGE